MTIHERRAGRRRRERTIALCQTADVFRFCRRMVLLAGDGGQPMIIYRVDRHAGEIRVTVPVWA
jgi:hypothetical protein